MLKMPYSDFTENLHQSLYTPPHRLYELYIYFVSTVYFFFLWGVSLARRINVVIVNLCCMVFRFLIVKIVSFTCPHRYKQEKVYAHSDRGELFARKSRGGHHGA